MSQPSTIDHYIRDLSTILKERARQAKAVSQNAPEDQRAFALGRLMAFHEVISLMQQQAHAFGLSLEEIGLHDIQPEAELV